MCVFVYTQTLLTLVTCCNNREAFICVGGIVLVVALAFVYCSTILDLFVTIFTMIPEGVHLRC